MKKYILSLLLLIPSLVFGQLSDAALRTKSTTDIAGKNYDPGRADAFNKAIIDNKVSIIYGINASGTNAYTASSNAILVSALATNMQFLVHVTSGNTGASTITITSGAVNLGTKPIVRNDGTTLLSGDIPAGGFAWIAYDGTSFRIVGSGGGAGSGGTFASDIVVSLCCGKTLGKYTNGQTIPSAGKTPEQVMNLIAIEYINPSFIFFSVSQTANVEIGTTISGSKAFSWSINAGTGVVNLIDIFDVTANSTLLSNTPNDGSQSVTITTVPLTTDNQTQSWKGILHDAGTVTQDISSATWTMRANYLWFYGPATTTPNSSATVRALAQNDFSTTLVSNLLTGTTATRFEIALPPTRTLFSVKDVESFNADITSSFTNLGTLNVQDAGGTNRIYTLYEYRSSVPYSPTQHTLNIVLH